MSSKEKGISSTWMDKKMMVDAFKDYLTTLIQAHGLDIAMWTKDFNDVKKGF